MFHMKPPTEILKNPFFWLGLILRLGAMLCFTPQPQLDWFLPFWREFFSNPSLDPWNMGPPGSFPYGIGMFCVLAPLMTLGHVIGLLTGVDALPLSLRIVLLASDLLTLATLHQLLPGYEKRLVVFYWLCPVILIATYWTGQLDIIPISLTLMSLACIQKMRFKAGGLLLALAISAKFSLALTLPFYIIYFFCNNRLKEFRRSFFASFLVAAVFLLGPPVMLEGYRRMVMGTSELYRLLDLHLPIGPSACIYLTPVMLLLVIYAAWRVRRLTFSLLTAFLALAALLLVLGTQTPPGWYLWPLPFLIMHLVQANLTQRVLGGIFFCLAASHQLLFWPFPLIFGLELTWGPLPQQSYFVSLWHTAIVSIGIVVMIGVLRHGFYHNELFRFGRRPISIAIAGDSGVGKDTLANTLLGLFGEGRVVHLSGDDYHFWDRKGAMWKALTHLNPRANDLKKMFGDMNLLLDKKDVIYRHYNHNNGCFSAPQVKRSREICIVSGLHTLMQQTLCARFDLRIFMSMEDDLRFYFKMRRDQRERGYTRAQVEAALKARAQDSKKYIIPQASKADIIFTLGAIDLDNINFEDGSLPEPSYFYLRLKLRHALYYEELVRQLVAFCGLQVDLDFSDNLEMVIMRVEGDIQADDIAIIAKESLPELTEFLAIQPHWQPGMQGVMQLVILNHLLQALRSTHKCP